MRWIVLVACLAWSGSLAAQQPPNCPLGGALIAPDDTVWVCRGVEQAPVQVYTSAGPVRIVFGSSGVFGSVPEARAGLYVAQQITADEGVNPTGSYAFGQRFIPTLIADANNTTLIGLETEPLFSDTGSHSGVEGFAHYTAVITDAKPFTLANAYGTFVDMASKGSGSSITNLYGLYINPQTAGSVINRAIHTAGGDHYFGGSVRIIGNTTITGGVWANAVGFNSDSPAGTLVSNAPQPIANDAVIFLGSNTIAGLAVFIGSQQELGAFWIRGATNATTKWSDPGDEYADTKDTPGRFNVYYDVTGPSGAGYYFQNKQGGARTVRIIRHGI